MVCPPVLLKFHTTESLTTTLEFALDPLTTFKKSRNKYNLRLALKPVSAAIAMRTSSTLVELLNCVLLHNVVEYIYFMY